jgi:hypothetical protein
MIPGPADSSSRPPFRFGALRQPLSGSAGDPLRPFTFQFAQMPPIGISGFAIFIVAKKGAGPANPGGSVPFG